MKADKLLVEANTSGEKLRMPGNRARSEWIARAPVQDHYLYLYRRLSDYYDSELTVGAFGRPDMEPAARRGGVAMNLDNGVDSVLEWHLRWGNYAKGRKASVRRAVENLFVFAELAGLE